MLKYPITDYQFMVSKAYLVSYQRLVSLKDGQARG